jgi:hypothetical protein
MFDSLSEWWFTLEAWWQELTPDSQVVLVRAAVLLGVFLTGEIAGRAIRRRLRAGDFDPSLRAPAFDGFLRLGECRRDLRTGGRAGCA